MKKLVNAIDTEHSTGFLALQLTQLPGLVKLFVRISVWNLNYRGFLSSFEVNVVQWKRLYIGMLECRTNHVAGCGWLKVS